MTVFSFRLHECPACPGREPHDYTFTVRTLTIPLFGAPTAAGGGTQTFQVIVLCPATGREFAVPVTVPCPPGQKVVSLERSKP